MKNKYILITLIALATFVTGCMNEEIEGLINPNDNTSETNSVITLTTDRADGILNLSVDAPEEKRSNIWIDLNGDGLRAEDGSEDIKAFNTHQDYKLVPGLKTVSIYGDITYLAGASNQLTAIDIAENSYLKTLNVPLNKLTAVDISKNNELTRLDVSNNSLKTLDVSENRALVSLWSFNNELSQLNLSNNPELVFLDCSGNQLNSLDVSHNKELVRLLCFKNQLTSLDISQNNQLNRLWVYGNPFSDKETERIIDKMKETGKVDLWISDRDNMFP